MTCCRIPPAAVHAGRGARQRRGGVPGDGRRPLDLLPLEAQGRPLGPGGAQVRERRRPRMPNQIGPHLEQRIIAFALGHPGLGPRRISAELAREKWGGIRISEHGVWRVLRAVRPEHARQAPGVDRAPPRPLRAQARAAAARAPHRRHGPARRSSWTASTSAGCRAPRAPSGNTPPSTSPPPTSGPSCTPPSATPAPATPASCSTASPASSTPPAGSCARSPPTTAPSSAPAQFGDAVEQLGARQRFIRPAARTPTAASNASS